MLKNNFSWSVQEGNSLTPVETSRFGLNVSPIVKNGAEEGTHMRKVIFLENPWNVYSNICHKNENSAIIISPSYDFLHQGHQVDYRNLIQDAVKGAADTDFSVGQLYFSFI